MSTRPRTPEHFPRMKRRAAGRHRTAYLHLVVSLARFQAALSMLARPMSEISEAALTVREQIAAMFPHPFGAAVWNLPINYPESTTEHPTTTEGNTHMSMEEIREKFNVPAKRGGVVQVIGHDTTRRGTITGSDGEQLLVKFGDDVSVPVPAYRNIEYLTDEQAATAVDPDAERIILLAVDRKDAAAFLAENPDYDKPLAIATVRSPKVDVVADTILSTPAVLEHAKYSELLDHVRPATATSTKAADRAALEQLGDDNLAAVIEAEAEAGSADA